MLYFASFFLLDLKHSIWRHWRLADFLGLLVGGLFCKSYSAYWDSAIKGISSITSVSVVVILLLVGMFSQLIKICGISSGFVWLANSIGLKGGLFVAFTFLATCIVSTATGSSIGTMFIAFPIFYPAGMILGLDQCGWRDASCQEPFLATILLLLSDTNHCICFNSVV